MLRTWPQDTKLVIPQLRDGKLQCSQKSLSKTPTSPLRSGGSVTRSYRIAKDKKDSFHGEHEQDAEERAESKKMVSLSIEVGT
ncbi:hypothetical protein EYC84_001074 [Monilinia fructicola]|uniref:Uncharacterized protein n=1 Tax=Monilinia fructicola TaxID=38448 RepID=A0A5M9JIX0_MONFR|nr:hypothetical protein EYC84_001074 [Monilinia fructicola]